MWWNGFRNQKINFLIFIFNKYSSVFIAEAVGYPFSSYMILPTECLNGEFEQINEWNVTYVIANKKLPVQSEFESHNKPRN